MRVIAVRPEQEVERALQPPAREAIQQDADRATFDDPMQPAAGIETVFVNGQIVWRGAASTGLRPGRALRRQELERERDRGNLS